MFGIQKARQARGEDENKQVAKENKKVLSFNFD